MNQDNEFLIKGISESNFLRRRSSWFYLLKQTQFPYLNFLLKSNGKAHIDRLPRRQRLMSFATRKLKSSRNFMSFKLKNTHAKIKTNLQNLYTKKRLLLFTK